MAIFCFLKKNTLASKSIVKKLMTTFFFNDVFEETEKSHNSHQLRIDLDFLVLHKHIFVFVIDISMFLE